MSLCRCYFYKEASEDPFICGKRLYHSGIKVFAGLKGTDLADYKFPEEHQQGR
jgi:hypothetical protein